SAGEAVFVVREECTWSAPGAELFYSSYGVALDFIVIFYCHVYAPRLSLFSLSLRARGSISFQDIVQFYLFHTVGIFIEFGIALAFLHTIFSFDSLDYQQFSRGV